MSLRRRGPRLARSQHPQLRRIAEVTGWTSQRQMCRELGKPNSGSTVALRATTGKPLDEDWLWQIAYRFGVRFEWLKTGEGPKERRDYVSQLPDALADAIRVALPDADAHEHLARCARVLTSEHTEARLKLIEAIRICEAWLNLDRELRAARQSRSRRHPSALDGRGA